jgi:TorA maturation chaperone TorD
MGGGFTCLFVGPSMVEAPPWESYYLKPDRLLFQEATLEVRRAYAAQGFLPAAYPHVADDHIALELDFMARLAEKLAEGFDKGDSEAVSQYLAASDSFLQEHLLKWVPDFVKTLSQAKHNYFYKEAGALLDEFVKVDAEALEEIKSYLKG